MLDVDLEGLAHREHAQSVDPLGAPQLGAVGPLQVANARRDGVMVRAEDFGDDAKVMGRPELGAQEDRAGVALEQTIEEPLHLRQGGLRGLRHVADRHAEERGRHPARQVRRSRRVARDAHAAKVPGEGKHGPRAIANADDVLQIGRQAVDILGPQRGTHTGEVDAYSKRYGKVPPRNAVVLVCAVAEHETRCGDAWNHAHNWGAIQRRAMTAAERAIVQAGGTPPPTDAFEELHGDSSPVNGNYQTWFWRFPDDVQGANKLLEVLLDHRLAIKSAIDTLATDELARLMYLSHYYAGFHDPRPQPGETVSPGGFTAGQAANVADYAGALRRCATAFLNGLGSWKPGDPLPPIDPNVPDLSTLEGVQAALVKLGYDPGPVDGEDGPQTRAAIQKFQIDHQPDAGAVHGVAGPRTCVAIADALAAPHPSS